MKTGEILKLHDCKEKYIMLVEKRKKLQVGGRKWTAIGVELERLKNSFTKEEEPKPLRVFRRPKR